jgi:hypothetical protein
LLREINEYESDEEMGRHVACMGEIMKVYRIFLEGTDHLEDLGLDGRIIVEYIFEK